LSEIWAKINQQIANKSFGRLFAIVDIGGHQHKLTEGDLVMVLEDIGAPNGKRIRLEKIPLVGSKDFTLIGRPYLPRDLVTVDATVVEKAMGHKKINHYRKGPREVKMTECKFF
jgi:large subunit ribosomal protein L21